MVAFAAAVSAIGVAVFVLLKAAKALSGAWEPRLNRFWPLLALALGVGLAWIPGSLDYICELAGGDLTLTASPAAKTMTGLIAGGCSAMYHSLWRTTALGK